MIHHADQPLGTPITAQIRRPASCRCAEKEPTLVIHFLLLLSGPFTWPVCSLSVKQGRTRLKRQRHCGTPYPGY